MLRSCMCALAFSLCIPGLIGAIEALAADSGSRRIGASTRNPWYWEYRGKPVLLLGGSVEDNLFQIPDLRQHLDLLRASGGNYVRNTMSSRDEGNVWPFARQPDGRYDLRKPGTEYWKRFETLLKLARERDIIVQIELWDRFDFARDPWQANPYNPKNNVNYTEQQSRLKTDYKEHPGANENPFFRTPPALEDNALVLGFQKSQVDRMLSISLKYPNVLYCMDNETSGSPLWGKFWAEYIRSRAREARLDVHCTEMWDAWDLKDAMHRATLDHPETYSFVDVSQNNHLSGQAHWDGLMYIREYLAARPRPMNSVKVYGADTGNFGTDRDGQERFWRNIFAGLASSRFHRPNSGLGLGAKAQASLRSARMLLNEMDLTRCRPDNGLLTQRSTNEAYCSAESGKTYAVYFPGSDSGKAGEVTLDLSAAKSSGKVRWLDIAASRWEDGPAAPAGAKLPLQPPSGAMWVALVKMGR